MENVFDKVGAIEKEAPTNTEIKQIEWSYYDKTGMIWFENGRMLCIYTGYKPIKMTEDHELNRIRLFLTTHVNPKPTDENYGKGLYCSADFYIGKSDKYYKITKHAGNKQSIIGKGYDADEAVVNAFGGNPADIAVWGKNFSKERYKAYITYLKFKNVCDKHIQKEVKCLKYLEHSRAVNREMSAYYARCLSNGQVITLPHDDVTNPNPYHYIESLVDMDKSIIKKVKGLAVEIGFVSCAHTRCEQAIHDAFGWIGETVYEVHELYEHDDKHYEGNQVDIFFGTDKRAVIKKYLEASLGSYARDYNNKASDKYEEAHRLAKKYMDCMEVIKHEVDYD